jgi:uncharacterized membrane protein
VVENDGHPPVYYATLYLATWPFRTDTSPAPSAAEEETGLGHRIDRPTEQPKPSGDESFRGGNRFPPAGITDAVIRFPSAFAGCLTVLVVFLIERRIAPGRQFPLATALLAVSPFAIYYSQDARNYVLAGLWVSISTYFLLRAVREQTPSISSAFGFVLSATLGLYTFYYVLFFLIAQAAGTVISGVVTRKTWKRWTVLLASPLVLFLPYLPVISAMKARLEAAGAPMGFGLPSLDSWLRAVAEVSQGFSPFHSSIGLASLVLCCFLALVPVVVAALDRGNGSAERRLLLTLFAAPSVCLLLFPFKPHLFQSKHLFPLCPVYALLLADAFLSPVSGDGMSWRRRLWLAGPIAGVAVLIIGLDSLRWYYDQDFVKEDWRGAAAVLSARLGEEEAVVPAPDYLRVPLMRYFPAKKRQRIMSARRFLEHRTLPVGQEAASTGPPKGFWLVELLNSPVSFEDRSTRELLRVRGVPEEPVVFPGHEGTIRVSRY